MRNGVRSCLHFNAKRKTFLCIYTILLQKMSLLVFAATQALFQFSGDHCTQRNSAQLPKKPAEAPTKHVRTLINASKVTFSCTICFLIITEANCLTHISVYIIIYVMIWPFLLFYASPCKSFGSELSRNADWEPK